MEKKYVLKVAADGRVEREVFDAADSLGQLQRAVGGWIERVPMRLKGGIDLFVDEEGLLKARSENVVLTRYQCSKVRVWNSILGPGVFAAHDGDGETVGLTEAECADFARALARFGGRVAEAEA